MIRQSEAAECGLACLAMVLRFHGRATSLVELRLGHGSSLKGLTLWNLMQMAHGMGFATRALRLEPEQLARLKPALILHWDLNHFVVLDSVSRTHVQVHDPARGVVRMTLAEFSDHFTGVVLELSPTPEFKTRSEAEHFSVIGLWQGYRGLPWQLSRLLLLSLALQGAALAMPLFLQRTVDQVLPAASVHLLLVLALGFALLAVFRVAMEWTRGAFVLKLSVSLVQHMGTLLFHHLMRVPVSYFERRHLGDVLSRFRSIDAIRRTLTTRFVESIIDGMVVIFVLAMMLAFSVQLTMIVIIAAGCLAATRVILFGRVRGASATQLVLEAEEHSYFLESMRASQSIRLFNRQAQRESAWQGKYLRYLNANVSVAHFDLLLQALHDLLFGLENIAVVAFGALAVMEGHLSLGSLLAFIAYKDQFTSRTAALVDCAIELKMLGLHAERVADIAMTPAEELTPSREGAIALEDHHGTIRVENLGFRYSEHEPWVFRDLSFDIRPGECVVITGASGCGKTTLMKVMLGLLAATEGKVRLDGREIRGWGLSAYRDQLAAVTQEDHLLTGSLLDNITYFDPEADSSRAVACAQAAMIHDDIEAMPMQYNSLVGDMGSALSGGQRQRLFVARALYRRPRVLFLDEATSHLDSANEAFISDSLRRLSITRVIVAHRSETIALGDRVLRLECGQMR